MQDAVNSMKTRARKFLKARVPNLTEEEAKKICREEYSWPQRYLEGRAEQLIPEVRSAINEYLLKEFVVGVPTIRGIVFIGDIGLGKSTLMGMMGRWMARTFYNKQLYITAAEYNEAIFKDELLKYKAEKVDLLFLDQVAVGAVPNFAASKITELIDARYADCRTTYVALNMTITDMKKIDSLVWMADRMDDRAWMAHHITMNGKSLRERK